MKERPWRLAGRKKHKNRSDERKKFREREEGLGAAAAAI
jgi:hypothetical protein